MFSVLGITWIAEVISRLLNYGFGYNNFGVIGEGPSGNNTAIIIKASFLFDRIKTIQENIMFYVLFFDESMLKLIRKYLKQKHQRHHPPAALTSSGKSEKSIRERGSAVKFGHHAQQFIIRTNRSW